MATNRAASTRAERTAATPTGKTGGEPRTTLPLRPLTPALHPPSAAGGFGTEPEITTASSSDFHEATRGMRPRLGSPGATCVRYSGDLSESSRYARTNASAVPRTAPTMRARMTSRLGRGLAGDFG